MRRVSQSRRRSVAVLIESSRQYGRQLLLGVARFAGEVGRWSIFFHERKMGSRLPDWMDKWQGDGILIHSSHLEYASRYAESGQAVVSFRLYDGACRFPVFCQDDEAIARMAVDFFVGRGFRHFAFCGIDGEAFSLRRERSAAAAIELAGYRSASFGLRPKTPGGSYYVNRSCVRSFVRWLKHQPKPLGLFVCNDDIGFVVISLCRTHGIRVPDDVAILGVDNDPVRSTLVWPNLSSIETNASAIGYEAARHLEHMMSSGDRRPIQRFFRPRRVVERTSTDIHVVDDPLVQAALDVLRREPLRRISIKGLTDRLGVCRKTLDSHFRAALKSSPHAQLVAAKLAQAVRELETTSLPIQAIAQDVGLSAEYFCRVFKKTHGMSPGAFRESLKSV